ncbi:Imm8 family immunity protein [Brevibacillus choshinensis]|uniref:Imm8 family immunity protein n=1 Tax=Brevibacillus choshinensis TaxID=54911 RepID=UPI002E21CB04|nr:Imm8 family immunity protein [Brevibacillus choshinensis]
MIELKALTIISEDWGETVDDFCIFFQLDVGPKDIPHASDLFSFDVVSPKRLEKIIEKTNIEIGRGYLVMNDFNLNTITTIVERIIKKCCLDDFEISLEKLSKYFRWENDN